MKKIIFLFLLGSLFVGNEADAHKTAYGRATMVAVEGYPYKVVCLDATATCYTIYSNGAIDVFYETGTIKGSVDKIVNASTQETEDYESLPDDIEPGAYEIYMD